jgi:hypothetical protein
MFHPNNRTGKLRTQPERGSGTKERHRREAQFCSPYCHRRVLVGQNARIPNRPRYNSCVGRTVISVPNQRHYDSRWEYWYN